MVKDVTLEARLADGRDRLRSEDVIRLRQLGARILGCKGVTFLLLMWLSRSISTMPYMASLLISLFLELEGAQFRFE